MYSENRFHKFLIGIERIYCGAGSLLAVPESEIDSKSE